MQPSLLEWTPPEPQGETFDRDRDGARLNAQCKRVFDAMRWGEWKTLSQISHVTHDPEASVSARLRDLKRHGFDIRKEYVSRGLWRYRMEVKNG